jgi:hypothetical protein
MHIVRCINTLTYGLVITTTLFAAFNCGGSVKSKTDDPGGAGGSSDGESGGTAGSENVPGGGSAGNSTDGMTFGGAESTGGTTASINSCQDGKKSLNEDGIDCGFICRTPCLQTGKCSTDADCAVGRCVSSRCEVTLSGVNATDLTLSTAQAPYVLNEDIQVGQTLEVGPGVVIIGNGHAIRAVNDVSLLGTAEQRITLKNVRLLPGSTDHKLPAKVRYENVDFIDSDILPATGSARYLSFVMIGCRVTGSKDLYVWYPFNELRIERNVFISTGGISVGVNTSISSASISHNYFEDVSVIERTNASIFVWANYSNNPISVQYNTYASVGAPSVAVTGDGCLVNASNSYWGTTDESVIAKMIFDKNDDLTVKDTIAYEPFLTSPDPTTPDRNGNFVAPSLTGGTSSTGGTS